MRLRRVELRRAEDDRPASQQRLARTTRRRPFGRPCRERAKQRAHGGVRDVIHHVPAPEAECFLRVVGSEARDVAPLERSVRANEARGERNDGFLPSE